MAYSAESVVVEVLAKTDSYRAAVESAATVTASSMSKIEQSASRAEAQIVRSAGAMANTQRNLGRQIADIGVGLSGGQSPFLILAQQAPQVADALADTGCKAASVARFFAGPWGAALLAAGSALGVLLDKVLETGGSVEDLVEKLEQNEVKTRLNAQAQAIFEKSLYGAAAASAEMSKRLREQNKSQIEVAQSALAAAQAQRQVTLQNLRGAVSRAMMAQEEAAYASSNSRLLLSGQGGGQAQVLYAEKLAAATQAVSVARKGLAAAESAVVDTNVPLLRMQAAEQADRSAAATGRHTRAVDSLTEAYRKAQIAASAFTGARGDAARTRADRQYQDALAAENRRFDGERDTIRESERKPRTKRDSSAADGIREAKAEAKLIEDIHNSLVKITNDSGALIRSNADLQREAAARFRDVFGEQPDVIGDGVKSYEREAQAELDARTQAEGRAQDIREDNVRSLAYLYEDLFQQGTEGVWRNFKDQGLRALALILAQASVASFGAGGGGFGSLLGNIGKGFSGGNSLASLFGRASGGYVGPGQTVRVNEGGGRAELLRMGPQGGTVIPLGQQAAAAPARGGDRHFHISVDARNSVTPAGFAQQIVTEANRQAAAMDAGVVRGARAGLPAALDRFGKLGTTG